MILSPDGQKLLETLRTSFEALRELEKTAPHDVDVILAASVTHIRSWKPLALAPMPEVPS